MKKAVSLNPLKMFLQVFLLLAIFCFNLGASNANIVHASATDNTDSCGQKLADAKAKFMALLPADGSIPATPEVQSAAQEYIHLGKFCYDQFQANNSSATLQTGSPIDDGALIPGSGLSADYVLYGTKWGFNTQGSSGGTVTYSFMPSGLSIVNSVESSGSSIAISSLPGFQPCFITDIQTAFAAWQAVSNIKFEMVEDSKTAFNTPGATGDIRIAAHAFDGPWGTLAHGYFPPPAKYQYSDAGDIHFDSAENWTCNTSGVDIGIVALHEIGHTLGLSHDNTSAVAVMDPYYNPSLTGLQPDDIAGIQSIYGPAAITSTPPANDDFANAITIPGISYLDTQDLTAATEDPSGPIPDPDNIGPCTDTSQHFNAIEKSVWYKYTPSVTESIAVDTQGSTFVVNEVTRDLDTFLAIWTLSGSTLNLVKCNDDDYTGYTSSLSFIGSPGVTYYFETGDYSCYYGSTCNHDVGGNLVFNVHITNTNVTVGSVVNNSYYVPLHGSVRKYYTSVNSGPVKVISTVGNSLVASERVAYTPDGSTYTSYSEMMGLPDSQLTYKYWFPFYNSLQLNTFLSVSNVGNQNTTVTVTIGGTVVDTIPLTPNQSVKKQYPNRNTGPVKVVGSNTSVPIITSERISYSPPGTTTYTSFSEMMGLPDGQLTYKYWFPFYNSLQLNTFLSVSNVGTQNTTVTVTIGGNVVDTIPLIPNQSVKKQYPSLNTGPVKVVGSNTSVPIITSERISYSPNGGATYTSFSELMGMPDSQLDTIAWFPWYNSIEHNTFLSVSNVGTQNTTVTVTIGGNVVDTIPLIPNQSVKKKYDSRNTGPVKVEGSNVNVPIIASSRVSYSPPGTTVYTSFSEMLGLPDSLLDNTVWFPFYNSLQLNTELRFAAP